MKTIFDRIKQVLYIIGGVFFCFTMLLMVVNVIGRSFFDAPVPGAYELTGWGASFFAAVAIPIATLSGTHIRVDILISRLKGKIRLVLEFVATIFDVFFAAALSYGGFVYAFKMLSSGEATNSLAVPIGPARLLWAISAAVMVIANIYRLFKLPGEVLKKDEKEGEE